MRTFFLIVLLISCILYAEENLVVEPKIIKQEYNKEEINKIKVRLYEIEKSQKYILDSLAQKESQMQYPYSESLDKKIDQIISSQRDIQTSLDKIEKDIKRQLLFQNLIQFVIFGIFFFFVFLLYKYKKETNVIETKIDSISSKIDSDKKDTVKFLVEKAKDNPNLAMAIKKLLDEK